MPNTRTLQRVLVCKIALLGIALPASAHPGGAAVSIGSNPIRSFSGALNLAVASTATSVFTVPASQDLIVTDVVSGLVADTHYCMGTGRLIVKDNAGLHLAEFPLYFSHLEDAGAPNTTVLQATSGIRIPASSVVNLEWVWSYRECSPHSYRVPYLFTGYLTQP